MQSERAQVDSEKEFVEMRALVEWLKDENSRLKARNHVLEDRSRELRRSSEEKDELIFKLTENETLVKGMSVRLKERFEERIKDSECREKERVEEIKKIGDKCWQLRVEKRKLEIELEAARGAIAGGVEALETTKMAAKAEIESLKSLVEERDGTVTKLTRENEGLERFNKEKNREIDTLLNEKMVLTKRLQKENQKISVLVERAGALEKEAEHVKDECLKLKREKNTEIDRIVDEKIALEAQMRRKDEQVMEKTSELFQRLEVLQREKQRLEAEVKEKDEVIQVIKEDNDRLVATVPNDGSNARKRKHPARSSNGDDLDENTVIAKSKKSTLGLHKPTGLNVDQDLLDAFDSDHELCLKAICALYRQHMCLARSKSLSPSPEVKVFKPEFASKAIALAEYLTDENPEGGMKKSVADLDRVDPTAVEECVEIAKQHYKQVFELYQKGHLMFLA